MKCFFSLIRIVLPVLLFMIYNDASGQQQVINEQKTTAKSEILFNGPVYFQPYIFAVGSSWYFREPFQEVTIYKCKREFNHVKLNYNLVDQKLVVLYITDNNEHIPVELNTVLVDSFAVDNDMFVNSDLLSESLQFKYLLQINRHGVKLYAGFKKNFINRYSQNNQHGYISSLERTLFLFKNDTIIRLKSNKDLLKLLAHHKSDIREYLKRNKINIRKSDVTALKLLMEFINSKDTE